jgi:hypothetical protein
MHWDRHAGNIAGVGDDIEDSTFELAEVIHPTANGSASHQLTIPRNRRRLSYKMVGISFPYRKF